jgi:glycosyltransferase involved in cell wall biosynthesis
MPNGRDNVEKQRPVVAMMWPEYRGRAPFGAGVILQLNESGFDMRCLYISKVSDNPDYIEQHGIGVFYAGNGKSRTFSLSTILHLSRYLKENKVMILHCHHHKATICGILAAMLAGTPVVFSHVHGLNRTRTALRRITNRIFLRRAAKIIAVSDAVRQDVLATNHFLKDDKVVTIRNSTDFARYAGVSITRSQARKLLGISEEALVFGTVGRLEPTKGQTHLIEAFAKIKKAISNARLVIVGTGQLKENLEKRAASLSVADSVIFTGFRSDVPEILRAFDCFVLPSLAEGMPGALLEAMAASRACIASAVGGIPEILTDSIGILIAPGDVNGLKAAMLQYIDMPAKEREDLGRRARDYVEKFHHQDRYAERLGQLYNEELVKVKQ